jgi:hypothetical protein
MRTCNLTWTSQTLLLVLTVLWLQGCATGVISVHAPEAVPPRPVSLVGDVFFDICSEGYDGTISRDVGKEWTQMIESVLLRDFGIQAKRGEPLQNKPFSHFLVTWKKEVDWKGVLSVWISMLTFSAIPGYAVGNTQVDIQFVATDANGMIAIAGFSYTYRTKMFVWIPLMFYPDFFFGINGGYINEAKESYARELVMRKSVLDADDWLRRPSIEGKKGGPLPTLDCPASVSRQGK